MSFGEQRRAGQRGDARGAENRALKAVVGRHLGSPWRDAWMPSFMNHSLSVEN
jgi:hypothetical protein